ncbi:MAG: hypothetical protein LQ337_001558 [Flavoplaca oasis]|nr:MAG: hypothetical protein LQ337_001558 [Flavoplaca oasis]
MCSLPQPPPCKHHKGTLHCSIDSSKSLEITSIMSNGPNRRTSGSILEGSVDAVWGAIRLSTMTLRDVIMAQSTSTDSPIPSVDGSSSPSTVIPSIQSRRAACTHLTMEPLYGDFECMVCHNPSRLGWLYSCTQDEREDLVVRPARSSIPSKPAWTADLAPWIQEAIVQGHYTAEQIERMVAQRQKVIDTVAASEAHFKKTQSASNRTSVRKSTSTTTTVDASHHIPIPTIQEVTQVSSDPIRQSIDQSSLTKARIFPYCRFRACQMCRPSYRDRTWQVFEDVFSTRILPPDLYDIDVDRPVSRLDLVRNIGTRRAKAPRPPLRTLDSMVLYGINNEGRMVLNSTKVSSLEPNNEIAADVADERAEPDSKGFRDSVKRAFKGMLMSSRKRDSWSSKSSRKSSRKRDIPDNEDAEFDLGLWKQLSEELLCEAAAIPLPGHDGKDGIETEDDEVEVQDGVAVTEEAVETGTADIIMSV